MAEFLFGPTPNDEARKFLESKPVVSREVFDELLPEIRGRTFLITGVEDANLVQDIRDRIADLTSGGDWDEIKAEVAAHLTPWLEDGAASRAELLLRTHGYQAYAAAEKRVLDRQRDVFPFLMYQAAGDGRVRDSHQALDGKVLPADSPFWDTHFPPWEFGCRCQVVPLMPEDVENIQAEDADLPPEARRVLDDTRLREIEQGTLRTVGEGNIPRQVDVRSPTEKMSGSGFSASPGSLRIPIEDLRRKYDEPTWGAFESLARDTKIDPPFAGGDKPGVSVWDWLQGDEPLAGRIPATEEAAANFARGMAGIERVLKHQEDAIDLINRSDIGSISVLWGNKSGGVKHILSRRTSEGEDAANVVRKLIEVMSFGPVTRYYKNRLDIEWDGFRAVLSLGRHERKETWLLSGFRLYETKK